MNWTDRPIPHTGYPLPAPYNPSSRATSPTVSMYIPDSGQLRLIASIIHLREDFTNMETNCENRNDGNQQQTLSLDDIAFSRGVALPRCGPSQWILLLRKAVLATGQRNPQQRISTQSNGLDHLAHIHYIYIVSKQKLAKWFVQYQLAHTCLFSPRGGKFATLQG